LQVLEEIDELKKDLSKKRERGSHLLEKVEAEEDDSGEDGSG
jgi:hypothetical protein